MKDYAALAAQYGGAKAPKKDYGALASKLGGTSLNSSQPLDDSAPPELKPGQPYGAQFPAPWEPGAQESFMKSPVGRFFQKQAPEMQQALNDEEKINPLERGGRVLGQAIGGVGNMLGGAANVVGGFAKQTWETPGNIGKALSGKPTDESGAFQAMGGLNQAVGGAFQTVSSPLAASPVFSKALSLPFEGAHDIIGGILHQATGLDPQSEHGKIITDSLMNGILLAAGGSKMVKELGGGKLSLGDAWESAKQSIKGAKDIPGMAKDAVMQKLPSKFVEGLKEKSVQKTVTANKKSLSGIVDNNSILRKLADAHKEKGVDSVDLLSKTDLLKDSVDKDGTLHTKDAQKSLENFIKPYQDVVRNVLDKEGKTIKLKDVQKQLIDAVNNSKVKGAAKIRALSDVKSEVKGLKLDADKGGNISLSNIHDAKINKQSMSNYLDPEKSAQDKLVASQYKKLVEDNTDSIKVKEVNKELQKHYSVQDLLEKLNGRKVKGGRLGKYFASTVGGIAGSGLGPLGTLLGSEVARGIQGGLMKNVFSKRTGIEMTPSEILQSAKQKGAPIAEAPFTSFGL